MAGPDRNPLEPDPDFFRDAGQLDDVRELQHAMIDVTKAMTHLMTSAAKLRLAMTRIEHLEAKFAAERGFKAS